MEAVDFEWPDICLDWHLGSVLGVGPGHFRRDGHSWTYGECSRLPAGTHSFLHRPYTLSEQQGETPGTSCGDRGNGQISCYRKKVAEEYKFLRCPFGLEYDVGRGEVKGELLIHLFITTSSLWWEWTDWGHQWIVLEAFIFSAHVHFKVAYFNGI